MPVSKYGCYVIPNFFQINFRKIQKVGGFYFNIEKVINGQSRGGQIPPPPGLIGLMNFFCSITFTSLDHFSIILLVLSHFGVFLTYWKYQEIQDFGTKTEAIVQLHK